MYHRYCSQRNVYIAIEFKDFVIHFIKNNIKSDNKCNNKVSNEKKKEEISPKSRSPTRTRL